MALESMHRIIKQNYFKGKVVKRLDEALNHILTYLDDKQHDHLIKSTKGKITRKNTNIFNNHNKAMELREKFTIQKQSGKYNVCKVNDGYHYTVEINQDKCQHVPCEVSYKDCDVCLHRISCDCFENSIHFEMCIHCHLAMHHNLCNNSSGTEADAHQQTPTIDHQLEPSQDFDFPDDLPDNFDEPNKSANLEIHQKHLASKAKVSKNLDSSKSYFEKQWAELDKIRQNIHNSSNPCDYSKGGDILLMCRLQLKYRVQNQMSVPISMAQTKSLSRKRKLSHQKRSIFMSTKKKCTSRKNTLKNPTWAERKQIVSGANQ